MGRKGCETGRKVAAVSRGELRTFQKQRLRTLPAENTAEPAAPAEAEGRTGHSARTQSASGILKKFKARPESRNSN